MTIPTLIANINGAKYRSQFKKTLSTLNQAVRTNIANYDFDFSDIDSGGVMSSCNANDHPEETYSLCAILNGSLKGIRYGKSSSYLSIIDVSNSGGEIYYKHEPEYFLHYGIGITLADGPLVILDIGHADSDAKNHIGVSELGCTLGIGEEWTNSKSDCLYKCTGFIDVNGISPPNKPVQCSNGKTLSLFEDDYKECVVKNDTNSMGDIFPIVYHDATVEPLTNAARYVLQTAK